MDYRFDQKKVLDWMKDPTDDKFADLTPVERASALANTEINRQVGTDANEDAVLTGSIVTFVTWARENTDLFDPVFDGLTPEQDLEALVQVALEYTGEDRI